MESVADSAESVTPRHFSSSTVRIHHRGMMWTVDSGLEGVVAGPDAPDWLHLQGEASAELVKSNPARRVWRVTAMRRAVYVKEFFRPGPIGRLVAWVRRDAALTEWRAGRAVAARGVACPHVIGLGRCRRRSVLVSAEVQGATLLSDAWSEAGSEVERRELIAAVAHLVGGAHAAGVVHGDDHPRNVLIGGGAHGGRSATYTDLYSAGVHTQVSDKRAVDALSQLDQWFRLRASGRERLRFLRAYCRKRCGGRPDAARLMMRRLAPAIAHESRRRAFRLWAKRDRRMLRTNSYFARVGLGGFTLAHVALPGRRAGTFPETAVPTRSRAEWRATLKSVVRHGRAMEATTWREPEPDGRRVRVTRFEHGHGQPQGRILFVRGHRLRNRDLPVRWPVACIVGLETNLLIEGEVEETESLLRVACDARDALCVRRQACAALARTVWRMAEQATCLRFDLDDPLAYDPVHGRWIIRHSDSVRFASKSARPSRLRIDSAICLYRALVAAGVFRRTDGVRFLKGLAGGDWKDAWRQVQELDLERRTWRRRMLWGVSRWFEAISRRWALTQS